MTNGIRRFAIGDIHGCFKTFRKLLLKIDLQPTDELYILGDMIDRGENSAKVLEHIIELKKSGYKIFPIMGNHEQMLLDATKEGRNSLIRHVESFGSYDLLNAKGEIKKRYLKFLLFLPLYIELDKFILVHASLNLLSEDIYANNDIILYAKYHTGNLTFLKGKKLIHGHTVTNIKIIENNVKNDSKIIGIDNGCVYYGRQKGIGKLVCLNLDTMAITTKTFCD